jgi:hypothetical protein
MPDSAAESQKHHLSKIRPHGLADQSRAGGVLGRIVHAGFSQIMGKMLGLFNGINQMIKSFAVAAAFTIGLAGYAFAQNTTTGAPAGTTPETPAPGTPLPIPGVAPAPTGSHSSQMRHRANTSRERARASAHHMRHKPAPKPAT